VLAAATVVALPATASAKPVLPSVSTNRVLQSPLHPVLKAGEPKVAAAALKTFTKTIRDHGSSFKYTLVGQDPSKATSNTTTTIKTEIFPLVIKLGNGDTFDPTVGNACDSTPAMTRTMNSPLFTDRAWKFNGVSAGTTQYVDAFRRSEFTNYTGASGINPNYHVKLAPTVHNKIVVNVPLADSAEAQGSCGKLGAVEINWLDNYLQNTLLPSLSGQGVKPSSFQYFVVGNVVEYITTTANCCVLGYHNAYSTAAGTQTYSIGDYENSGAFGSANLSDVEIASHEIAEWYDDPYVDNPTKPWGNVGQVSGCQSNLEVGDPLTGTTINKKVGTFTYHLQELAYFSWFYHQSPSWGAGGKYSNNGTFTSAAAAC
jgi:hypothetical protein